jgi:hypothetical protein
VKLGVLSMIVFLIDEIKIEFLRFGFIDYWQYIFSLFAMFLGFADLARSGQLSRSGEKSNSIGNPGSWPP